MLQEVHPLVAGGPPTRIQATPFDFVRGAFILRGEPLDLSDRPWLPTIYNLEVTQRKGLGPQRKALFVFGRQCEKTLEEHTEVLLEDGSTVAIRDIHVGDRVVGLAADRAHTSVGTVSWKSRRYIKPGFRIRTQAGFEVEAGHEHPFRSWGRWVKAENVQVGDRLAVVRRAGEFAEEDADFSPAHLALAACMIAEGHCCRIQPSFTQNEGPLLWAFLDALFHLGWIGDTRFDTKSGQVNCWKVVFRAGPARNWFEKFGILGHKSAEKTLPDWVWDLSRSQTAYFLNLLWAGDGYVGLPHPARYLIEYDTISKRLARDVQRLLHKFGIPSRFRRWKPTLYKGTDKWAYKVSVQTQDGIRTFLTEIGALGKSEGVPLPKYDDNSNRDTYPAEIQRDLNAQFRYRLERHSGCKPRPSPSSAGLRRRLQYPPSRRKLAAYVEFFESLPDEFDPELTSMLRAHVDTDLYWDEVVEVEPVEVACFDISVDRTESFVANGFVTHNSSSLGYKLLTMSAMVPFMRSLYVNPSIIQVRDFSDERLNLPMMESPIFRWLTSYPSGVRIPQNVNTKWLRNASKINLRHCFLSPDRIRGLSIDDLKIDEFQDILTRNLPVIEETQFACKLADGPITTLAGTPKGFDSPLEVYWSQRSTQCEWTTCCGHCGSWNVFDRGNLTPAGLVCSRCRGAVDPVTDKSMWVAHGRLDAEYAGFRLPQPVVVYAYRRKYPHLFRVKWADQLNKDRNYPPAQLQNEVWARSFDSGTKPITREQLRACCDSEHRGPYQDGVLAKLRGALCWAGIDWGSGAVGGGSTCLVLWRYQRHRLQQVYHKRYQGFEADEEFVISDLVRTLREAGVARIGVDYGFGYGMNSQLRKAFPGKVIPYMYCGKISPAIQPDEDKFKCHRTQVMSWYYEMIKRKLVLYPVWDVFSEDLLADYICISQDESRTQQQLVYNHPPGTRDDFFHAGVYGVLVSMFDVPRPDVVAPGSVPASWLPDGVQ